MHHAARLLVLLALSSALAGCDELPASVDAGDAGTPPPTTDAGVRDAAAADGAVEGDAGLPPASACETQGVIAEGDCGRPLGVFWDGAACVSLSGCTCIGPGCTAGFADVAACEAAHAPCTRSAPDCVPDPAGGGGPECAAEVRYVTTAGSADADGLTAATAWSLAHAVSAAGPGTTVFVQAGDYGDLRLDQTTDGTAEAPIRFIGTDPEWNLVRPHGRASVTGTEPLDPSLMPMLRGVLEGAIGRGTGFRVRGDHVHLESFQVTRYSAGFEIWGARPVLRNLVSDYHGNFTGSGGFTDYDGWGITVTGDGVTMERCFVRDAGAQGVTVQGADGVYRDIEVVGTDTANDMDYYFLFNGNRNHASRIHVYRTPGISHLGHGIVIKPVGADAADNVVDGFTVTNTNVELQFGGCQRNTIKNGVVRRDSPVEWSTAITLSNGASDNLFQNIVVTDAYAGVVFNDWDDGAGDESAGDLVDAGHDNDFVNLIVRDCQYNVFFRDQGGAGVASRNRFIHSTFIGGSRLFRVRRGNDGTELLNCVFAGVDGFANEELGFSLDPATRFDHVNVSGSGFSDFGGYDAVEVSTHDAPFAEGDARPAGGSLDVGADPAGWSEHAATDFHGVPRVAPFTLGAFEYAE